MGDVDERPDEVEHLRQRLAVCERDRERMAVALDDAHGELRRLAEQVDQLRSGNLSLAHKAEELSGHLARFQARSADVGGAQTQIRKRRAAEASKSSDKAALAEQLRVTVEELQVTADKLEEANLVLRRINQDLERRVEERTVALTERDDLLRHKELLMKEVEHRVKNSLQMVASLLSLQGKTASPETRQALQIAIGRIHAVARVHALLYAKGGAEAVRFDRYLHDVCTSLGASFGVDGRRRTLLVEADPVMVPVDAALALATAVNELVTNALRYAFAVDRPGTIWVQFRRETEERLILTVADDGRGLPPHPCCGLGLQIVSSVAEGLKAEMSMAREGGARVTLSIPATLKAP